MRNIWIQELERRCLLSAGAIDHSFGKNGVVVGQATAPMTSNDIPVASDAAIQSDGKSIVVGNLVMRLGLDGSLDTTYGSNGVVNIAANQVAIDASGRAIIATASQNGGAIELRRLKPNGSLDTAFGKNGVASVSFQQANPQLSALAVTPDGKIVVAGVVNATETNPPVAVERLLANGTADPSFGTNGVVTFTAGARGNSVSSMAIDSADRIILCGTLTRTDEQQQLMVVRLLASGALDPSLNGDGIVSIEKSVGESVAIDGQGRYIAGGWSYLKNVDGAIVVRFLSDGSVDTTFGKRGETLVSASGAVGSVFVDPDNSVRVVATDGDNAGEEYHLSADGAVLSSFEVADSELTLVAVDRLDNGTFVTVTNESSDAGTADEEFSGLANYRADGTLATTPANDNGTVFTTTLGQAAVTVSGKLAFVGLTRIGFVYSQYNANGSPDQSFNGDGRLVEDDISSKDFTTPNLIPEGDGHLIGYDAYIETEDPVAVLLGRVDSNGQPDDIYPKQQDGPDAIQPDSNGGFLNVLPGGWVAATYTPDEGGELGVLIAPNGSFTYADAPELDALDEDYSVTSLRPVGNTGTMVFTVGTDGNDQFAPTIPDQLIRTNADGTLDKAFGDNGAVTGNFVLAAAQINGGVLLGYAGSGLARLNHLGHPDKQFGTNGIAAAGYSGFTFDSQDRIIAWKTLSNGKIQIARFTYEGKPDLSFGTHGVVTIQPAVKGTVNVLITPSNDLVVTTLAQSATSAKWSAVRILG